MPLVKYNPKFFNPSSVEHAKKIILTEGNPNQWEKETKWTIDFFREKKLFNEESIVLDWGCGIGRLAKPIIEEYNCKVIGVDFQPNMLKYAMEYVNHPNFTAISNEEFSELPDNYFTAGIAVWALQHTINTSDIINDIQKKLKVKSRFCVIETKERSLPTEPLDIHHERTEKDYLIHASRVTVFDGIGEPQNLWAQGQSVWTSDPYNINANNILKMINKFSVEKLGMLPYDDEKNGLSKHIVDCSWWGIFINDKKNI